MITNNLKSDSSFTMMGTMKAKPKTDAPQVIRKSNELIEARYRLSVWEQRLILNLLANISKKDADFRRYRVRVADFAAMWQLESDNSLYEKVQDAADSLVARTIQLSDDPRVSETVSWLSYVKYVRGSGEIEMEFHSALKPYLLQLQQHFTQYQLGHVVNFRNQYSIRIYELLKMEVFKHPTGKFLKSFKYEDLRVLLSINEGEYNLFGHFKSRVITPTIDEISKNTDLIIENVEYGKTGRKITEIIFSVKVRPVDEVLTLQLELQEPYKEEHQDKQHPIVDSLVGLGFGFETARKYKSRFGVKRIERNIAYAKAKKEANLVKDFPAFLNKAIVEDMGAAWELLQEKESEEKQQRKTAANQKAKADELAHLKMMSEMSGVPLEVLLPKDKKGGN